MAETKPILTKVPQLRPIHTDLEPFSGVDVGLADRHKGLDISKLFRQVKFMVSKNRFQGRETEFQLLAKKFENSPIKIEMLKLRESALRGTPKTPVYKGIFDAFDSRNVFITRILKDELPNLRRASDSFMKLANLTIPVMPLVKFQRIHYSENPFSGVDLDVDRWGDQVLDLRNKIRMTNIDVRQTYDDVENFGRQNTKKLFVSGITGVMIAQGMRRTGMLAMTSPITPLPLKIAGLTAFAMSYALMLNLPFHVVDQLDKQHDQIEEIDRKLMLLPPPEK